jgi:hypothetical protein
MIVTSSVYLQSSAATADALKLDPENKFYGRMNHRRLEGEAIRDSILAVSGKLNPRMGGDPVRVPIEKEIYDLIFSEAEPDNLWPLLTDENEYYRRSLYLLNKRTVRLASREHPRAAGPVVNEQRFHAPAIHFLRAASGQPMR